MIIKLLIVEKRDIVGGCEARLSLVEIPTQKKTIIGGTVGTVDEAGKQLLHGAIRAGIGDNTKVHAIGDGASWIVNQVMGLFGERASNKHRFLSSM